jgi:hypothetical protein
MLIVDERSHHLNLLIGVGGGISGGSASQGGYIRISYQAYVRLLFYISALQNVVASSGVGLGVGGSQFGGNFAGGFSGRVGRVGAGPVIAPFQPSGIVGGPGDKTA